MRDLIDQHLAGTQDNSSRIWALIQLELWFRTFVDSAWTARWTWGSHSSHRARGRPGRARGTEAARRRRRAPVPTRPSFPKRRGIPRFTESGYSEAFGAQWLRYRRTQLDSYSGTRSPRSARAGASASVCGRGWRSSSAGVRLWRRPLHRGSAGARRVCHVGRPQQAVDADQENFPQYDRHRVAQADIRPLPFPSRWFDIVFGLGVVQHTPDPEESILALYEQVEPGGWLVFDHYSRRANWFRQRAGVSRVLKRLPPARGLRATGGSSSTSCYRSTGARAGWDRPSACVARACLLRQASAR